MKFIRYCEGYKYQLAENYIAATGILPPETCGNKFVTLTKLGHLIVREAYAWDGPSGPAIDTKNFMRGSLEHDALYQLMREGLLPQEYRKQADARLQEVCIEDGMSSLRAWWVYRGVRFGGAGAAAVHENPVLEAP